MTGAADWAGRVGQVWADEWRRTERAFAGIAAVLDAAIADVAPPRGRALDIGCGVGSTALALARAHPGLAVTGVDLARPLVAVARERAATAAAAPDFVAGDAITVAADRAPLDLLVSRHGVMLFDDPVAGFAALRRSAARGARLVFSCFRERVDNDWTHAVDRVLGTAPVPAPTAYAPGPYALADRAQTAAILRAAGWTQIAATAHDVRYVVGAGEEAVADALAFYRRIGPAASILAAASRAERAVLDRKLADMLATRIRDGVVTFTAAIWIWTARAGEAA